MLDVYIVMVRIVFDMPQEKLYNIAGVDAAKAQFCLMHPDAHIERVRKTGSWTGREYEFFYDIPNKYRFTYKGKEYVAPNVLICSTCCGNPQGEDSPQCVAWRNKKRGERELELTAQEVTGTGDIDDDGAGDKEPTTDNFKLIMLGLAGGGLLLIVGIVVVILITTRKKSKKN